MKAVVMAGGRGTRLAPLTDPLNKHLLPVGDRPMIHHVLATLARGGVTQALLLLNGKHPGLMLETVGDGRAFGLDVLARYTRDEAAGPGAHLPLAAPFTEDDDFAVMLGDSFVTERLDFAGTPAPHAWTAGLGGVDDPGKYWQARTDGERVTDVAEAPDPEFADAVMVGAWVFPPDAYALARRLARIKGDEVHVVDIARLYARDGRLRHTPLPAGSYMDLGTQPALNAAGRRALETRR